MERCAKPVFHALGTFPIFTLRVEEQRAKLDEIWDSVHLPDDPTIHYPLYLYLCMHIIVLLCTILYCNIYIAQGYGHVLYILLLFPGMLTSMDFEHGILNSDVWRIWRLLMSHINHMIQRFPKQQNIAYDWSHGRRLVSLVTTYALA